MTVIYPEIMSFLHYLMKESTFLHEMMVIVNGNCFVYFQCPYSAKTKMGDMMSGPNYFFEIGLGPDMSVSGNPWPGG